MLFMNIARKFSSHVYQEEAGGEAGSPAAAAPVTTTTTTEEGAAAAEETTTDVTVTTRVEGDGDAVKASIASFTAEYAADNPALSLALGFLGDAGIGTEDPAFQAAREGDFTLLKAVLAQKGLAGTDQMVAILEGAVAQSIQAQEDHEKATTATVQGILGEQHEEILTWARDNATDEEKTAVNEMLAAGGLYARAVAIMLRDAWGGADVTKPAQSAVDVSAMGGSGANSPMSASEYSTAVQALAKQVGGDPRGTPEYQRLSARRAAGRSRGI